MTLILPGRHFTTELYPQPFENTNSINSRTLGYFIKVGNFLLGCLSFCIQILVINACLENENRIDSDFIFH